jgi:hypothetical protein
MRMFQMPTLSWQKAAGFRHLVFALLIAALVPAAAMADADVVATRLVEDSAQRVVIAYDIGQFVQETVRINGQEYFKFALPGESTIKEPVGVPSLPLVCRSIIIPPDAHMKVSVLAADFYDIRDLDVVSARGFIPRTINPADVPYTFDDVYGEDAFYPQGIASVREPYIFRDYRGMVVVLCPFQYNPVSHTLRVYTEVTVEVAADGPGQVNLLAPRERELSLAFHQIYKNHFLNYPRGTRYDPLDEEGEMLVICHDAWLANIQPFVDHKNSIGIDTTVVGVSTIGNDWSLIKDYIQDTYDTTDLAFVLLVGDGAQVDTPYASGGSSDPTYSKLAGSDNYPDILVGRFSAETAAHVDTQVQRTITYELMPATEQEWFKKGTGIASNQGPGDDGEYDNEHMDNIRDDLLAYGYTEVDQIYDPTATASQVSTALNEGRGIVNYCGHGSTTSWSTTGFSNSHVNSLVNDNMLPFICSVACVNGQFDGPTCFAEAWLRATNGDQPTGAIGTYMSSINQSWSPPMCAQDEFDDLLVAEAYFSFGALCFAGSCQMMDEYGSGGVEMFNTWHVFGDPSVRVYGTVVQPPLTISLPDGAPAYVDPGEPTTILVQIEDGEETYVPGSGTLHYRYDRDAAEFQTSALDPLGGILFEATLPPADCSDTPDFYFSATGDGGTVVLYPESAPNGAFSAKVATVTIILEDSFETDQGWTVENIDLADGAWERGVPAGDGTRGDPTADCDGSGQCYLTANRAADLADVRFEWSERSASAIRSVVDERRRRPGSP